MGLEKLNPFRRREKPAERAEPTLGSIDANEARATATDTEIVNNQPDSGLAGVRERVEAQQQTRNEDDPVAAAMASIEEEVSAPSPSKTEARPLAGSEVTTSPDYIPPGSPGYERPTPTMPTLDDLHAQGGGSAGEAAHLAAHRSALEAAPASPSLSDRLQGAPTEETPSPAPEVTEAAPSFDMGAVMDGLGEMVDDAQDAKQTQETPPPAAPKVETTSTPEGGYDMGDGRIEPTIAPPGTPPAKVRAMILSTDPQVKVLKQKLNDGVIDGAQYHKELQALKDNAPMIDNPAAKETPSSADVIKLRPKPAEQPPASNDDEPVLKTAAVGAAVVTNGEKRRAEGVPLNKPVENVKEGDVSSLKSKKVVYGAAREELLKAQARDFEKVKAEMSKPEADPSPTEPEVSPESIDTSSFELFTFSDGFKEQVTTLLDQAEGDIDKNETMDILDSLADAFLKGDDAKFDRQKAKLDALLEGEKTPDGKPLNEVMLHLFYREMLRAAAEQRSKKEAASEAKVEYKEATAEQIGAAILAALEGRMEAAGAAAELVQEAVEKAEARGTENTLYTMVAGAALGAASFMGYATAAPALGIAVGGLTLGTAAVVGGGIGLAVAGAGIAITLATKSMSKKK